MKNKKRLWIVSLTLFILSAAYDILVIRRLAHENKMEKWTWLTVVVGVSYTLVGTWLVDRQAAWLVFKMFCFSGLPMSVGDLVRWWEREQNGRKVLTAVQRSMNGDV